MKLTELQINKLMKTSDKVDFIRELHRSFKCSSLRTAKHIADTLALEACSTTYLSEYEFKIFLEHAKQKLSEKDYDIEQFDIDVNIRSMRRQLCNMPLEFIINECMKQHGADKIKSLIEKYDESES